MRDFKFKGELNLDIDSIRDNINSTNNDFNDESLFKNNLYMDMQTR
jgi:hypothetical protein